MLLIFILISIASSKMSAKYRTMIKIAIVEVAQKIFSNSSNDIDVHLLVNSSASDLPDMLTEVLSELQRNIWRFQVKINSIYTKPRNYTYNVQGIILFDSYETFLYVMNDRSFKIYVGANLIFLAFIPSPANFQQIEELHWFPANGRIFMNHVFLIDQGDDYLSLSTLVRFAPRRCHDPLLIEMNRFTKKDFMWMTDKFMIADKFENFHGCVIGFGIENYGDGAQHELMPHGGFLVSGYMIDLMKELSRPLNFTPSFNVKLHTIGRYFINQRVDMVLQSKPQAVAQLNRIILATPHLSYDAIFLIPPGERYTSLEKLFLPFDAATWILLLITFIVALVVISIVQTQRISIRSFVFGTGVTTPTLNLFRAWFGLGQIFLPRRNFARFFLMLFILFSLIMRLVFMIKSNDNTDEK